MAKAKNRNGKGASAAMIETPAQTTPANPPVSETPAHETPLNSVIKGGYGSQVVREPERVRFYKVADYKPRGETKPARPGSKRALTIETLLEKGATRDELAQRFAWNANDVKDILRLVNKVNGYGVKEYPSGNIRAYRPGESAPVVE